MNRIFSAFAAWVAVGVFSVVVIHGQTWSDRIQIAHGDKLDDIIRKGELWFQQRNITSGPEWKDFHRWAERARTRVDAEGVFYPQAVVQQSFQQYVNLRGGATGRGKAERTLSQQTGSNAPSAWTNVAPATKQTNITGSQTHVGAGRVNCVRFHSTNANIMYIGTAGGGVWKTTNGGTSWTPLMDDEYTLPVLEIKDIAVDPDGSTLHALASGSVNISGGDGGTSTLWNCIYKSVDGGASWTVDSVSSTQGNRNIYWRRMVLDPLRPDTLYVAGTGSDANAGIYRSFDGGETWSAFKTNVQAYDLGTATKSDTTYVYSAWVESGTTATFRVARHAASGITTSTYTLRTGFTCSGLFIATAPGGIVYVLMLDSDGACDRLYRSSNYGTAFSTVATTAWPLNGSAEIVRPRGGSFEVCPSTTNTLYVGGAVLARSADGGKTWETISLTESGLSQLHPDHNDIEFHPSSATPVLFDANDCGMYKIEEVAAGGGTDYSLSFMSNGLEALQCNRLGVGRSAPHIVMLGTHDNGSYKFDIAADVQRKVGGGDGQEGMVDHDDSNILYWSSQQGALSKSIDGGTSNVVAQDISGGAWTTPFIMDHNDPETLYVAATTFYRSTDGAANWVTIGGSFASTIKHLVQATTNTDVFYAASDNALYFSTDGGATWASATKPAGAGGSFTDLAVDPLNEDIVYATFGGYNTGRVYRSTDNGATWSNVSTGLPALPAHSLVIDPRRPTEAYIGMEYGVWFTPDITSTTASWQDYAGGLPNVAALELELHADSQTLYAATSGRGLWKTPMKHTSDAADGYCTPQGTTADYNTGITKAQLIDNATGDTLMTISSAVNEGYTRYDTPMPVLQQGKSYSLRLTFANGSWLQRVHVWADWNRDGEFQIVDSALTADDSVWNDHENIGYAGNISLLNPARTFSFTVPADSGFSAHPGASYLRVGADWAQSPSDLSPCGIAEYGEYEDYAVALDYCEPAGNASANVGTTRVTMKLLPTLSPTVLDQSSSALAAYTDYTASAVSVVRGRNYRLSLTGATTATQKVSVFIDWNTDGDFNDSGEMPAHQLTLSTTSSINVTVSVPLLMASSCRMRVMSDASTSAVVLAPCSNPLYGEVEDYTLVPLLQSIAVGSDNTGAGAPDPDDTPIVSTREAGGTSDDVFRLSPNPVEQSTLFVECSIKETGVYEFIFADLFGREVVRTSRALQSGIQRLELQVPDITGVYIVAVKYRGQLVHSGRVVVR